MQIQSLLLSESEMEGLVERVRSQIGFGLFTLLSVDAAHTTLTRRYTSAPQDYRLHESWPLRKSPWQQRIFEHAEPVLCRNLQELHAMFPDAADIEALGLHSAISVPLLQHGNVVGVVNVLEAASRYAPSHLDQISNLVNAAMEPHRVTADRP